MAESTEGTSGEQGQNAQGRMINGRDIFADKHRCGTVMHVGGERCRLEAADP